MRIGASAQKGHVKLLRDIVSRRYFIVRRASSDDLTAGRREQGLLEREQAQALSEPALDLPDVDGRIYAFTQVHYNVRS